MKNKKEETIKPKTNQTHELFEKGNYKKKEKEQIETITVDNDDYSKNKSKKKKNMTKIVAILLITALVGSTILTSFAMFM